MDKVGKLITKSMTILDSTNENRFFEGYLTVEMKDKQGEITMVDELYKAHAFYFTKKIYPPTQKEGSKF